MIIIVTFHNILQFVNISYVNV